MYPWKPDDKPRQAHRIGKTAEECGELSAVLGRISIQGLDSVDPATQKTNRLRLIEELADVQAQIECNCVYFCLTDEEAEFFCNRVNRKIEEMTQWELHFRDRD